MYRIEIVPGAIEELNSAPIFYRRILITAIERKLPFEPTRANRNRKVLESLVAGFEYDPPLWELRVQEWRIFYDVDEEEKKVIIRAVRRKPHGRTTGEVV